MFAVKMIGAFICVIKSANIGQIASLFR